MIDLLYVDDEKINLMVLKQGLNDTFNVITAESGMEALEKLNKKPEIKAVISDMRMPKMNGVEFIRKAKNNFPEMAFFILTGYDRDEEIDKAIQDKLVLRSFKKPFDASEIINSVKAVLN